MEQEFASWYASMSFQVSPETIQQRLAGIAEVLKTPTHDALSLMARLAFRSKVNLGSSEVAALRGSFAGGGPLPGDDELSLLSASALAFAMRQKLDSVASLSALTVACASCSGLRSLDQPMELVGMSANVLKTQADTQRRRPSLDQGTLQTPKTEGIDAATQKAINEQDWATAFQSLYGIANKALGKMATRQRDFEVATQRYVTVQDEELDMLWWLQGGHSFHAKADFPDLPTDQRPLVVSYELASLTKVLPGPPAMDSILTRTGVHSAPKLSISGAVQAASLDWLERVEQSVDASGLSPHITPILFAITRRHEAGGTDEWIGPWATATGIARGAELEPLNLAMAAYREFVLVKLG